MTIRRPHRTPACEALEARQVLSSASAHDPVHAEAVPPVAAHFGPVGTLGDSYTDEYQFYPPYQNHARNWVEILHALRGVNFGKFSLRSRGEVRDQGFAYNWARYGGTSTTMVQNELPGLAQQVAAGQVKYAWIFVGGNDYLYLLQGLQSGAIPASQAGAAINAVTANLETNFVNAVDTLLAANPNAKLVLATLPPVSIAPVVQLAATTSQAQAVVQGVDQAIENYDTLIRSFGTNPRVAVVDLAQVIASETAGNTTGTASFGGQTINLTTPGEDYHDFFLADGLHVGTVAQGIIADEFAQAVDAKFGANLSPPDPRQIVRYARSIQIQTARQGL